MQLYVEKGKRDIDVDDIRAVHTEEEVISAEEKHYKVVVQLNDYTDITVGEYGDKDTAAVCSNSIHEFSSAVGLEAVWCPLLIVRSEF